MFEPRLSSRRRRGRWFGRACALLSMVGVGVLVVLLVRIGLEGGAWLNLRFLTAGPSMLDPTRAGVRSALWGTLWLITVTATVAVPLGIAAAVYLHEYARDTRLTRFIRLNIANLAGVPSIVYGILGLAVFVRWFVFDRSILSGGLTMALLVLPVIIIASREALAAVPPSFRLAAYALGATRWQTIWAHVLPAALPGIMTGVILAISRAIGEAAPLILLGALTWVTAVPSSLFDPFTVLPIQVYAWSDQPQAEFHHLAAAGIIVLLGILLPMNAVAIGVRAWHQRRKAW
ncbi:MAG: phosphate ABC transporter permease PstA [Planctomycetes bacterium]|nr:phosphate ABC transporter permease PstA [Planctomycetota bacterium]